MSLRTLKLHVQAQGALSGESRTLAEWGVSGGTLDLRAGGEDELRLTFPRNYDQDAVFPHWSICQLFDEANHRRFYGMALRPRQRHGERERRHFARVIGPHFWPSRTTHVQSWMFVQDIDEEDEVEVPQAASDISDLILYKRGGDNTAMTMQTQLQAILAHAVSEGAPIRWDFANFPVLKLPEQKDRMASDWALLTKQLRFFPHLTGLWDYAVRPALGGLPTLRFARSQGGRIYGPWIPKVVQPEQLAGEEIIPRDDLLVRRVKVCFVKRQAAANGGFLRTVEIQTSTANVGDDGFNAFGDAIVTVDLRAPVINGGEQTLPAEDVPDANLAARLHEAFLHLWHEFTFEVPGHVLDWSWAIGQEVHVFGHSSDVNAARAMVVGLSYDLASARTVVKCGPPGRLVSGSVNELLRPWQTANFGFKAKDDPSDGEEPGGDGGDDFPTLDIVFMEGAAFSTGRFHCQRLTN